MNETMNYTVASFTEWKEAERMPAEEGERTFAFLFGKTYYLKELKYYNGEFSG